MYGRQLRRSLALATGAVVAGEAAARVLYEGKERHHQHRRHPSGQHQPQSALLALLRERLAAAGAEPIPMPIPLLLESPAAAADAPIRSRHHQRERSTAAYFLGGRGPAGCDAGAKGKGGKLDAYHAVPLPGTDTVHTAEVVARLKPYVAARDLETVGAFAWGVGVRGGVWINCCAWPG